MNWARAWSSEVIEVEFRAAERDSKLVKGDKEEETRERFEGGKEDSDIAREEWRSEDNRRYGMIL